MLVLTEAAAEVVKSVTDTPQAPDGTGLRITQSDAEPARTAAEGFLERHGIGYVVIDRHEVTPELRQFAIDVLGLRLVQSTPSHDLYVPLSSSR